MTENDLRRKMFEGTRTVVGLHWSRIESPVTAVGIPDVRGTFMGRVRDIELKRGFPFKKPWRDAQRKWALQEIRAGGRVFLLSADDANLYVFDVVKCKDILNVRERDLVPDHIIPFGRWQSLLEVIFDYA